MNKLFFMSIHHEQLNTPITAVIFDCDGTLSTIEGIDELAKNNHVAQTVERLTQDAMTKSGMNINLYRERLELIQPTQEQVLQLGEQYIEHCVPDITNVIQTLQRLNKAIYIVSAGLDPAVAILGKFLQIPKENIFAVDIQFDSQRKYLDFDHQSPLVNRNGKRVIVSQIMAEHPQAAYIGDGLNDLEVKDLVTRFIGYGGSYYRENIKSACEFYLESPSMKGILPWVLTAEERKR